MKQIKWWVPVALWMAIIFFFSTRERLSVSPEELINFLFFKTLHVVEYAMLYILTYRALKNSYPTISPYYWAMWAFVIVICYAASDEVHQIFVQSREGRARDVIIDTLGASVAWILLTQLLPKVPRKLQKLVGNLLAI